ncbi:hypothetical protein DEA8626_03654 [Defluviimonas aquaemixtae]|uniref:ABM domain-containing protein n=1 Tax=Albidovulum aquaemixtae TaxID=1542388 RepID=A0A2R8BMR7_9RHOB|nr:hypothetical protein [Defluviimonas aquaemixtae]SPH24603.1 hypothetical protein DEA8626_03654 [Defluviimonas aquaemixtae]
MHAITRTYTGKGAAELTKLLIARKSEVEKLIGDVPGLVSYDLIETRDGCFTVTVCKDKAGTDKSLAVAKDWLKANAAQLGVGAPAVAEGKVAIHLGAKKPAVA